MGFESGALYQIAEFRSWLIPNQGIRESEFNYNESKAKKVWQMVFQPKIETLLMDL